MNKFIKKIIITINLFDSIPIEKQAYEFLIYIKELTEGQGYIFSYDFLASKRISVYVNNLKTDKLANLKEKPLKNLPTLINFIKEKDLIENKTPNQFIISNRGLIKINELESIFFSFKKIISFIGIVGGLAYVFEQLARLL